MGTVIPILAQNAIPVFADVERETFNLDPADVERRITPRTRAIIPVHLGGNPCDMEALMDIARRHELRLIEDCSQAYCATSQGPAGGHHRATSAASPCSRASTSPSATAGLTITDDADLGRRIALFADKGWPRYSAEGARNYLAFGFNYHMTELQGAVAVSRAAPGGGGLRQPHPQRRAPDRAARGLPGVHPQRVRPGDHSTYWFFALRAVAAETGVPAQRFAEAVRAEGVACGYQYIGKPIFLYEALRRKRIYGTSDYPFSVQDGSTPCATSRGSAPTARRPWTRCSPSPCTRAWGEAELRDIAAAFEKVSTNTARLAHV